MRIREFPEKNYKAIFTGTGKTVHFKLDGTKPYSELDFPEIMDVAINEKCFGRCSYCYIEAVETGTNFDNICQKAEAYFGSMSLNERPFQIAIGGAGEPTIHPDFPEFLKTVKELGIMPNYTTNGMHMTPKVLEATEKYAGGVAVTCHKHLKKHWVRAIEKLSGITRLNLHIIPMSIEDVDEFLEQFYAYKDVVEYFVILPYQSVGFGGPLDTNSIYEYLFTKIEEMEYENQKQIAYGAYFYEELLRRPQIKASLYEHGLFSKYMSLKDSGSLYNSSFEWQTPIKVGLW